MNKRVIIKSCGKIGVLKGICGPVLTPMTLSEDDIYNLLMTKNVVCEVLNDGTELKLNMDNYDIDNNKECEKEEKQKNKTPQNYIDATKK